MASCPTMNSGQPAASSNTHTHTDSPPEVQNGSSCAFSGATQVSTDLLPSLEPGHPSISEGVKQMSTDSPPTAIDPASSRPAAPRRSGIRDDARHFHDIISRVGQNLRQLHLIVLDHPCLSNAARYRNIEDLKMVKFCLLDTWDLLRRIRSAKGGRTSASMALSSFGRVGAWLQTALNFLESVEANINKADTAPALRGDDNEREYDVALFRMKRASVHYCLLRALATFKDVGQIYWNMTLHETYPLALPQRSRPSHGLIVDMPPGISTSEADKCFACHQKLAEDSDDASWKDGLSLGKCGRAKKYKNQVVFPGLILGCCMQQFHLACISRYLDKGNVHCPRCTRPWAGPVMVEVMEMRVVDLERQNDKLREMMDKCYEIW